MAYTYGSVVNCKVRNGQTRKEYELRLGYQVNSQDITTNTSNVTLRLECRSISSSYTTKGSKGLTSIIDGVTVKSNAAVDMSNTNTWQNFGERTITIYHNADGTCSVSKSGSFTCTAGSSDYSLSSGSASVTVAPTTIPRTSSIASIVGNTIGSAVTVNITRQATSFTHNVFYTRFDGVVTQVGTAVGTSCTFTPHIGDCQYLPNSSSGTAKITVDTYSGSTKVGSVSQAITLNVPSSIVPTISSISVSEGGTEVPSSWGVFVQGKSKLKVTVTASGSYGSTISTYKTTGIDNNTYWASSFNSALLQGTGTKTITAKVVDSRGREATKTAQYTCVAYSNPSISVATVTRCNADGTANEEGEYVKYNFKASIAPVSNKNGSLYQLGYKASNEDTYTYITVAQNTYSLDKKDTVISGVTFSVDNSYDFHFYIGDTFISTSSYQSLGTGFTLLDFNASGKGMAIGKVSEKEDALEVNMDMYNKDGAIIEAFKVSSTEPTNGEELWIQKGKNLFNKNLYSFEYVHSGSIIGNLYYSIPIYVGKPNTSCFISTKFLNGYTPYGKTNIYVLIANSTILNDNWIAIGHSGVNPSSASYYNNVMTSDGNGYLYFRLHNATSKNDYEELMANCQVQIELGSTATEYEAYIDKKIYCINNNDVYNEFLNVEKINNHLKQIEGGKVRVSFSLYENTSGTNGTITLSDSAANYNILEIFYRDNNGNDFNCTRVFGPNGKNVYLSCIEAASTPATNIRTSRYAISGTSMTVSSYTYTQIPSKTSPTVTANNYLYVTKVIGYK